jgi:uncharacterized membrane protein YjfL (UPF0719 family)
MFNGLVINRIIGSRKMGTELIIAGTVDLLLNLFYSFLALIIAIEIFIFVDKKLFTEINIQKELYDGNMAVSIFASIFIVFIGIIVSSGMATAT